MRSVSRQQCHLLVSCLATWAYVAFADADADVGRVSAMNSAAIELGLADLAGWVAALKMGAGRGGRLALSLYSSPDCIARLGPGASRNTPR